MDKPIDLSAGCKVGDFIVTKKDVLAALAYCAIAQSPYDYMKDLLEVLDELGDLITPDFNESLVHFRYKTFKDRYVLEDYLRERFFSIKKIIGWNISDKEKKDGIVEVDDSRRCGFKAVDIYHESDPETDFIDLDALIRNVAKMIEGEAKD